MEQIQAYIMANQYMAFAVAMFLGALWHWAKKAYRNEVNWNPLEYWVFGANKANSAGAIGLIVLAWWIALTGDMYAGASWSAIVAGGVGAGYALDSSINKSAPKNG